MDAWGNEVLFFFFELSNEVLLLSLLLFHFHSFFEMNATADGPEGNKPTRGAGPLRRMMGWPICVSTPDGPVVALAQSYSAQKEPSSPALDSPDSGQSTSALATRVRCAADGRRRPCLASRNSPSRRSCPPVSGRPTPTR